MPFKSEAQHRKFRVLLSQGKITQDQFDEWMDETKEKHGKKHPIKALPERVKQAFLKQASDYPSHVVNLPSNLSATDDINENNVKYSPELDMKKRRVNLAKRRNSETKDKTGDKTANNLENYVHFDKNANSRFCTSFLKHAGGPGSGVSHNNVVIIDFLKTSPIISIGFRQKFMDLHKPSQKAIKIPTKSIKYKGQEKMVPKKLVKMIKIWEEVKDKPIDVIVDKEGNYHILDGHHRALAAILTKKPTIIANVYKSPRELE